MVKSNAVHLFAFKQYNRIFIMFVLTGCLERNKPEAYAVAIGVTSFSRQVREKMTMGEKEGKREKKK